MSKKLPGLYELDISVKSRSISARVRDYLPEIMAAISRGVRHKDICVLLIRQGIMVSEGCLNTIICRHRQKSGVRGQGIQNRTFPRYSDSGKESVLGEGKNEESSVPSKKLNSPEELRKRMEDNSVFESIVDFGG